MNKRWNNVRKMLKDITETTEISFNVVESPNKSKETDPEEKETTLDFEINEDDMDA